jgi:hypothetical protein
MSRENLEAVRQVCAHWERGEWAAGGELIDPDVEVVFSTTSALNRLHGRGKESGALVDAEVGVIFEVDGGVIRRMVFCDRREALEATGLAE